MTARSADRDPRELLAELSEGSRFEVRADETDLRFDLVTLRIPVRPDGSPPRHPAVAFTGRRANEETLEYYLTQAAGVLDQLHAHDVAARVRDVLGVYRAMHEARRRDAERRSRCDA